MTFEVGDRVVAESESTERRARSGTDREVLRDDPAARYRIDWDDGHSTVYTPAAGALHAAPAQTGSARCRHRRRSIPARCGAGRAGVLCAASFGRLAPSLTRPRRCAIG